MVEEVQFGIDCPFKDNCSDRGVKCTTCRYSIRPSHYEPNIPDYFPPIPYVQ